MKKIVLIIFVLIFYQSLYSQWIQSYNLAHVAFYKIQFVNDLTGYIVGDSHLISYGGVILKTTDGGNSWLNITSEKLFHIRIFDLSFLNANTGFVSGYSYQLYKTNNGGLSWNNIQAPIYGMVYYRVVQFLDENTGYIGGRYGKRFKTTNGGYTWDTLSEYAGGFGSIYFINADTGFMGTGVGVVNKTTNGGVNWTFTLLTDTSSVTSYYALMDIDFLNEMTGYIVGGTNNKSAIFKTTNCGNNWRNIYYKDSVELYSIDIINASVVYAAGEVRKVLKTTNGGETWSIIEIPGIYSELYSIQFINENTGFTSGYSHVFKTTNGGVFVNQISSEVPEGISLYQNYPNPFNPNTKIRFDVTPLNPPFGKGGTGGFVKLVVYDLLGRKVATLVNERLKAGTYEVSFDGGELPSGVYFSILATDGFVDVKKMLLVK